GEVARSIGGDALPVLQLRGVTRLRASCCATASRRVRPMGREREAERRDGDRRGGSPLPPHASVWILEIERARRGNGLRGDILESEAAARLRARLVAIHRRHV